MSNPGVLYLARKKLISGKDFRIEDNIGESIHLHYDELRLDFSVDDFFRLSKVMKEALFSLITVENFSNLEIDPFFLSQISSFLIDLEEIKIKQVELKKLKVETINFINIPVVKGLHKSRVFKAFDGKVKELAKYRQENYLFESNIERANRVFTSIKNNSYNFQKSPIILFNEQNNIRDGQHRAASLLKIHGNHEIPVYRFYFKNNKYNAPKRPYLVYIFCWNKKRIKSLILRISINVKTKIRQSFFFIKSVITNLSSIFNKD